MTAPCEVCIGICTFRRPELLRRLLEGLARLDRAGGQIILSGVVVDNDAAGSARDQVQEFAARTGLPLAYAVEPERNFALVRNRAVSLARGDFLAFIDDDEVPVPEWLVNLVATRRAHACAGVLGPVRPYFDRPPPRWILQGRLCERPAHPTGMVMAWQNCRTGNVLLDLALFRAHGLNFDPAYGTGGEDVDFFRRATAAGHRFVWCEEAPAYELVPDERCRKSYFLRRALLQGRVSLKYAAARLTPLVRLRIAAVSLAAIGLYLLAMPALLLGGFHLLMKYLIKGCHHFGRLCALLGINLVPNRNF